jgi:hypothetical protein
MSNQNITKMASKADILLVGKFLREQAPLCIHKEKQIAARSTEPANAGKLQGDNLLSFRFVTPSYGVKAGADDQSEIADRSLSGHYLQMYDWDACFFSTKAEAIGAPGLALDVVSNFLALIDDEGHIPRTVSPGRIWDAGDQCKPFLASTYKHYIRESKAAPDPLVLKKLERFLGYFEKKRKSKNNLYRWRNVLESGVDDNLALIAPREAAKDEDDSFCRFIDGEIEASDLSTYLAVEFQALSDLYKGTANSGDCEIWQDKSKCLIESIETLMFNDKLSIYCNLYKDEQLELKSWTGLAPVLFGIASKEHGRQIIENTMLNPNHFLRPFGLTSHAISEPLANQQRRGLYGRAIVSNWQGPMWVLPNALAVKALLGYGYEEQARELAGRVLKCLAESIEKHGTLYENYDAESGAPLWAPQFISWNILALDLVHLLLH